MPCTVNLLLSIISNISFNLPELFMWGVETINFINWYEYFGIGGKHQNRLNYIPVDWIHLNALKVLWIYNYFPLSKVEWNSFIFAINYLIIFFNTLSEHSVLKLSECKHAFAS